MLAIGLLLNMVLAAPGTRLRDRLTTSWEQLIEIGLNLIFVAILFLVARYLAKFLQRLIWRRIPIDEVTPATESLVNNSLALFLYALAFTLTLAFLGASWSTLLTAFSVSTIAVIFGLADLLKSILGGAFLIFERPYEVGDRIKIRDNEGEVTEIGVRTTTLVTDDHATVILPNSLHLSEPFRNFDRQTQVASVIHIVGIDGERESVNQLIAKALGTEPAIEGHVALKTQGETGFVDRTLTALSNHGFGSSRRTTAAPNPNSIHARIQLKVDQATSRETEAQALDRLRSTFPDAIVSIRRGSLIEDEWQDVD
jgi:hypothetical protein